ncbi:MAG: CRISPR system precrRNA processing endoribonuclease RAMP protein Cas6 [Planctomycetes bacterium]|nr:CRISPR system precrRNA processing endoribonuclease RAMP protein Cas6 [Planctomycetota bacterium]
MRVAWDAPPAELLEALGVNLLRFECVAPDLLQLGREPANQIRSALGVALRGKPDVFTQVFDPPPPRPGRGNTGQEARALSLRVLARDAGERTSAARFAIELVVLGPLRRRLDELEQSIVRVARQGLGQHRVPFAIASMERADGADLLRSAPRWSDSIQLYLRSRLRVIKEEQVQAELPFETLVRALLRRYSSLMDSFTANEPEWDYRGIVAQARAVSTEGSGLHYAESHRYSVRQGREMPFGGLLGQVRYYGPLAPYLGLLGAGQVLQIGKGTAMGHGFYELDWLAPGPPRTTS